MLQFQVLMPCRFVGRHHFREMYRQHLQDLSPSVCFSKALVSTYKTTLRQNPEEEHCHTHLHENLKSDMIKASLLLWLFHTIIFLLLMKTITLQHNNAQPYKQAPFMVIMLELVNNNINCRLEKTDSLPNCTILL